jgi:cytochrome c5
VGDAGAVGDVGAVSDAGAGSAQADAGPSPEAAVVAIQPVAPVKKKGIDLEAPGAMARAKSVYVRVCSSCHGLEETERYGKHTEGGWRALIRRMNTDNDAGVKPGEVALIAAYLAKVQGK